MFNVSNIDKCTNGNRSLVLITSEQSSCKVEGVTLSTIRNFVTVSLNFELYSLPVLLNTF